MSAYNQIKTDIKDAEVLKEALRNKGFADVEHHETPQQLVGYMNDKRQDRAEIIIRRKHVGAASNDLGFKKDADGNFEAIISSYDKGKYNDAWLKEVKTECTKLSVAKKMKQMGAVLLSEKEVNGKIRRQYTMGRA